MPVLAGEEAKVGGKGGEGGLARVCRRPFKCGVAAQLSPDAWSSHEGIAATERKVC